MQTLGLAPKTLAAVLLVLAGLAALTTICARWYEAQRAGRSERFYELANAEARERQFERAVENYRNAFALAPTDTRYTLALAEALIYANRLTEASFYLRQLLQAEPADGEANLLLARIAAREGRTEQAINSYQRAIYGYWTREAESRRLEARWEMIGLLQKSNARTKVVAELLQIPAQAGGDLAAKKKAAALLLEYGSAHQALDIYRESVRSAPRDAEAEAGIGRSELALGDLNAAAAAFHRALRLDTGNEALRKEYAAVREMLSLDPLRPGLSAAERYRRSREVLERTAATADTCTSPAVVSEAALAGQLLSRGRRVPLDEAADQNIRAAERLWSLRAGLCPPADEALTRLMPLLEKR